jgi:hypothetical protein
MKNPKYDLLVTIVVAGAVLCAAIYMFHWAYNLPSMPENICKDERAYFGFPCRTAIDQLSNGHAQVFIDGSWIDICDSNIGNYCTAN